MRPRRATHQPTPVRYRFRIRWAELCTALAVVALVVALILIGGSMIEPAPAEPAHSVQNLDAEPMAAWPADLEPCATEDSSDCYWDARVRGNGQGESFIAQGGFTLFIPAAELPVLAETESAR